MKVTRNELAAITTPEETATWKPVPHLFAVETLSTQLENMGIYIRNETFEIIGKKGEQLFASFILDQQQDGIRWSIGMRNSHNKCFALGIAAGNHVTVCSNLVFDGEFVEFRRHTRRLTLTEISAMMSSAIASVIKKIQTNITWQLNLKTREVNEREFKILTFDAMANGIILPSKFAEFTNCLEVERGINGDCLYSFHGGVTRTLREANLFTINERTNKLHTFIHNYMQEPVDVEPIYPPYHLGSN